MSNVLCLDVEASKAESSTSVLTDDALLQRRLEHESMLAQQIEIGVFAARVLGGDEDLCQRLQHELEDPSTIESMEIMVSEGELARAALFEEYRGLVIKTALPLRKFDISNFEDILSAGYIGLLEAIRSFDYKRGNVLGSYAVHSIKKSIYTAFRLSQRGFALSQDSFALFVRWNKTETELFNTYGRQPLDTEIVERMGIPIDKARDLRRIKAVKLAYPYIMESYGHVATHERDTTDNTLMSPEETVVLASERSDVLAAVSNLSERHQEIVMRHYGMNGPAESVAEIAASIGVRGGQVYKLLSAARKKIKEFLGR